MNGLVLFDIDGTLLRRAGPHHREALVEAIRTKVGVETSFAGIDVAGRLDRDILRAMLENTGVTAGTIRRHMAGLVEHAQAVYVRGGPDLRRRVCPGARLWLYKLWRRGIPTGLVTGNLTAIGWTKMERAGLRRYLRFGAFAEQATDRAGLVERAIREARAEGWIARGAPVTLVGDHPNDIRAARANGVRSIAVGTGVVGMDELARHAPDVLVEDLRALRWEELFG